MQWQNGVAGYQGVYNLIFNDKQFIHRVSPTDNILQIGSFQKSLDISHNATD